MAEQSGGKFDQIKGRLPIYGILVLSMTILFLLVHQIAGDYLQWKSYDLLIKNVGGKEEKPHKDVMLLLIDEASMKYGIDLNLGRWPWKRSAYPEILDFINKTDPPRAIFFDILFSEPDMNKIDQRIGVDNDSYFAQSVASCGNIYHNVLLEYNPKRKEPFSLPPDISRNFTLKVKDADKIIFKKNVANEYTVPLPCLRSAVSCTVKDDNTGQIDEALLKADTSASGISVALSNPDGDGVYRRGRILFTYIDKYLPSMTLSAIKAYSGTDEIQILGKNRIRVGKYSIPVDKEGDYLANYYKGRIPATSMSAIMLSAYYLEQGEIDKMTVRPSDFKDKIVIIGVSAVGGQDLKNTPLSQTTPGPEIHATMISNILQGNHIIREADIFSYIIMFIIILITAAFVMFFRNPLLQVGGFIVVLGIYIAISTWQFSSNNYLSQILFIFSAGFLTTAVSFIYLSLTEGAEKRKYSKILSNMIDPTIVSEALNDLETLKKGGEKNITAFFSDIASFSTISEKLTSGELAALLNEYLSAMTIILKQHHGTLDKYIGDAIVGIFGAPIGLEDTTLPAARASLDMQIKLEELRQKWAREKAYCEEAQNMHFRIGLNTGMAKVGFMGTDELASYTMMGDTVNLAARLEAAGKDYGVEILVSEMTKKLIEKEMFLRELDAVRVKGKDEPVLIYELIGKKGNVPDNIVRATAMFEEAFALYRNKQWDAAIAIFNEATRMKGSPDKAIELLIDRCELYKVEPPPENWDGVFTRTHK